MGVVRHRLFWPVAALALLIVVNTINTPTFLRIRVRDGHLYGALIDILRNSSPLLLVAVGMTLVIATRGIDLSVGAVVAIAGAVALTYIGSAPDPSSVGTVITGIGIALVLSLVLGTWNGFLVSVIGIQPIIATLVLMTAGRGIAMLITGGMITTITSPPYKVIGSGYWAALPVSVIVAGTIFLVVALLTRRTALGMLIESVGINPEASRLAGVRSRSIIWTVYAMSALFAGIAGLMISSGVMAADANNAGMLIELDAILAVVIGGTSLAGGKFSLAGTMVGAIVLETLDLTVTILGIPPAVTPLFKAIVVIAVVVMQSPIVRNRLAARRRGEPGDPPGARGVQPAEPSSAEVTV